MSPGTKRHPQERLRELPLAEHLRELRHRILASLAFFGVAFILCYTFRDSIYDFATAPLARAMRDNRIIANMIYTKVTEAFTSNLSITFSAAQFLSIPFWSIELWLFITPALYKDEKKQYLPYILLSPALFLLGAAFCYFLVLPPMFGFFLKYTNNEALATPLILEAKIEEYVSLTSSLMNAFGICFLTPIFLGLLVRAGAVSRETLKSKRKYAVVLIFIAAAVLTPPDVVSQILLAVPLMAMYELSILLARPKNPKSAPGKGK
ncbi:MAG: twin-arginine translocase subunit TatC [Rickettsiales bacterium]|jgi:sec-independent protein translocase protein TatC|nr:twin-arginine translocase subunit TatC [Rickettsiales bacterium]